MSAGVSESRPATQMRSEISETPQAVRRLLDGSGAVLQVVGRRLRELDPPVIVTAARGSSDHAAGFFKYCCEIRQGVPVASIGPSIASIYNAPLRLHSAAAIAISQSGRSPDLLALIERARAGGAVTLAIVNDEDSPLARAAEHLIPLRAGPERSVAATKSFIASCVAGLALVAAWSGDAALANALEGLPSQLEQALGCDWSAALDQLAATSSLYVLGRGPSFSMALEAALKFKETAAVHAEAYSGAEVLHGPVALIRGGFPVLAFVPLDESRASLLATLERLTGQGGRVFAAAGEEAPGTRLPVIRTGHSFTDAITTMLAFYGFVEALARARGLDPDRPEFLAKVTQTV